MEDEERMPEAIDEFESADGGEEFADAESALREEPKQEQGARPRSAATDNDLEAFHSLTSQ